MVVGKAVLTQAHPYVCKLRNLILPRLANTWAPLDRMCLIYIYELLPVLDQAHRVFTPIPLAHRSRLRDEAHVQWLTSPCIPAEPLTL